MSQFEVQTCFKVAWGVDFSRNCGAGPNRRRRKRIKMKTTLKNTIGWFLILTGALIVVFCNKIVFPGLERLVGIETIVGKENVVYQPDGGYLFTNPAAMAKWILSVAAIGILICLTGIFVLIRARKSSVNSN
jgi:hypothetical protein